MRFRNQRSGFGVIEILIAAAVLSMALGSLLYVFTLSHQLAAQSTDDIRATFLAEEGLETMRYLRDTSWSQNLSSLSPSTIYYLAFDPAASRWSVTATDPGFIDNVFAREIHVMSVCRDNTSQNIVPCGSPGSSTDLSSLKVTAKISWGSSKSISLDTYLSDLFVN